MRLHIVLHGHMHDLYWQSVDVGGSGFDDEIDHHAFFSLFKIFDLDLFAITGLHLLQ